MTTHDRLLELAAMPTDALVLLAHGWEMQVEELKQQIANLAPASTPAHSLTSATPRTDCVICPNCVHQFVATPEDVQHALFATREALRLLRNHSSVSVHQINVIDDALALGQGKSGTGAGDK